MEVGLVGVEVVLQLGVALLVVVEEDLFQVDQDLLFLACQAGAAAVVVGLQPY